MEPWALITGRFETVDKRLAELERQIDDLDDKIAHLVETNAVSQSEIKTMSDSFRAARTAAYLLAVTILAAAVLVIIFGKLP